MGRKHVEAVSIISNEEMEVYHLHLSFLTELIKAPDDEHMDKSEKEERLDKLDACLEYLVVSNFNSRDIQNMIRLTDGKRMTDNKQENIIVGINAVLNIYHLMQVFKTAVY